MTAVEAPFEPGGQASYTIKKKQNLQALKIFFSFFFCASSIIVSVKYHSVTILKLW